ncbi:MAG: helix-turn-helix transcriptional regulator [Chloroflexi bacterium]|nr:helix-turn-helix transcriptional regulator [Chloroflexota bacterium]
MDEVCPVAEAAKLLGDKWTLIVLRDLAEGPRRFGELERSGEGISPSMLAARLRALEEEGLVTRTSYHEIPPRVEYALTEKGRDAEPVVEALRAYGTRWLLPEAPALQQAPH